MCLNILFDTSLPTASLTKTLNRSTSLAIPQHLFSIYVSVVIGLPSGGSISIYSALARHGVEKFKDRKLRRSATTTTPTLLDTILESFRHSIHCDHLPRLSTSQALCSRFQLMDAANLFLAIIFRHTAQRSPPKFSDAGLSLSR